MYSKVFSGFLRQNSQSFYIFGKIQNAGGPELSGKKNKINVSLMKDFIFCFHIYFSASFDFYFLIYMYIIYIRFSWVSWWTLPLEAFAISVLVLYWKVFVGN